jgi:hypothetical protein
VPPPPRSSSSGYWYRCTSPEGYYPYVSSCRSGWQRVPATPPQNSPDGR